MAEFSRSNIVTWQDLMTLFSHLAIYIFSEHIYVKDDSNYKE